LDDSSSRAAQASQSRLLEAYGKLPLSFERNQGQTDQRVKFLSRGSGYSLFLTGNEAVLSLRKGSPSSKFGSEHANHRLPIDELQRTTFKSERAERDPTRGASCKPKPTDVSNPPIPGSQNELRDLLFAGRIVS
jgi:hypothetical protein